MDLTQRSNRENLLLTHYWAPKVNHQRTIQEEGFLMLSPNKQPPKVLLIWSQSIVRSNFASKLRIDCGSSGRTKRRSNGVPNNSPARKFVKLRDASSLGCPIGQLRASILARGQYSAQSRDNRARSANLSQRDLSFLAEGLLLLL